MSGPLDLSPAQALALADAMCENHAARCPVCEVPSMDRSNAGCVRGKLLAQQWAAKWRNRVDALSGRWSR